MKNLLTVLTVFFIATTLFAQKDMFKNTGHKNLPGEDFRFDYHKNDMIYNQLLEKEQLQDIEKNNLKTTYKGKANEQDSLALVALYNATDGDNWYDKTNWLTGNVADWYSITIDGNGRVTEIDFLYNNLTGSIPAEIGNLTSLTGLYLKSNQLTGSIPPEIGNLMSLSRLHLGHNQLTGSIPAEIGNLISLYDLYLQDNQFEDLPNLSALTNMHYFFIDNNKFTYEDIEPNINVGFWFYYSPQAKVGSVEHYTPNTGDNLDLTVTVDGTANTYQWYKDDALISGATSSTYSITDYNSTDDAGIYTCKINNTVADELTLESENIYVSTGVTISELENEKSFTVYPNPARDIVISL